MMQDSLPCGRFGLAGRVADWAQPPEVATSHGEPGMYFAHWGNAGGTTDDRLELRVQHRD